jgi:hypothetical protein
LPFWLATTIRLWKGSALIVPKAAS